MKRDQFRSIIENRGCEGNRYPFRYLYMLTQALRGKWDLPEDARKELLAPFLDGLDKAVEALARDEAHGVQRAQSRINTALGLNRSRRKNPRSSPATVAKLEKLERDAAITSSHGRSALEFTEAILPSLPDDMMDAPPTMSEIIAQRKKARLPYSQETVKRNRRRLLASTVKFWRDIEAREHIPFADDDAIIPTDDDN